MENCTFGGDMDMMSGAGLELGGADTRRDLLDGNCLLGERGEETGDDMEVDLGLLRSAGLGAEQPRPLGTASSSGRGPRVDPPLAELTPLIADTLFRSSGPPRELYCSVCSSLCGDWNRFCVMGLVDHREGARSSTNPPGGQRGHPCVFVFRAVTR